MPGSAGPASGVCPACGEPGGATDSFCAACGTEPSAAKLAELVLPGALTDPLRATLALVSFALDACGKDNLTVVLTPFPPATLPRDTRHPRLPASPNPTLRRTQS